MYYRIGSADESLGASAVPAVSAARRTGLPAGSLVPTIRARAPAIIKPLSAAQTAFIRARRQKILGRLRRIQALPVKALTVYAKALRGLTPPGGGFGQTTIDEGSDVDTLKSLVERMLEVQQEILDSGTSLPETTQQLLGGNLLARRAGDISAALGLDVTWRDLTTNCAGEFQRLQRSGELVGEEVLSVINFEHIAAVFKDQGFNVGAFRDFVQSAAGSYGDDINRVIADACAFGEGGLRRSVEDLLSTVSATVPTWLNAANLNRVGNAATAWVGAARSGETAGYVQAAGGTIALAGALVPQPAGAIVSAVGAAVSLIGMLLGDEDPVPLPPELVVCTGRDGEYDVRWAYNPEAWTALAFWVVAKEGFLDSLTYKEAKTRGILVQEVISDQGWWTTIDRYTGEIMVREPRDDPSKGKPLRRLLDIIDRELLIPEGDPEGPLKIFHEMAAQFGTVPNAVQWGGRNFLWCYPNPKETFTRFIGADEFRGSYVKPFRYNPTNVKRAPEHIGWEILGTEEFWYAYRGGLIASMYLAGTVPFGTLRSPNRGNPIGVSTGLGGGGRRGSYAITVYSDPYHIPSIDDSNWSNPRSGGHRPAFGTLRQFVLDEAKRLSFRIPMPSPDEQADPNAVVRRPGRPLRCSSSGVCLAPLLSMTSMSLLKPGAVFKREEPGAGLSRGWKIGLAIAGGVVVAGTGGLLYVRHARRSR